MIIDFRWKLDLTKYILRCHAESHDNYFDLIDHWYWRWFYSLKAIVCVWVGREVKMDYDRALVDSIAIWNWHHTYSLDNGDGADWEALAVGHGTFSNWVYSIYSDGYP